MEKLITCALSPIEQNMFRCGKIENRPAVLEPTSKPEKKKKSSHRSLFFVGKLRGWAGVGRFIGRELK